MVAGWMDGHRPTFCEVFHFLHHNVLLGEQRIPEADCEAGSTAGDLRLAHQDSSDEQFVSLGPRFDAFHIPRFPPNLYQPIKPMCQSRKSRRIAPCCFIGARPNQPFRFISAKNELKTAKNLNPTAIKMCRHHVAKALHSQTHKHQLTLR